MSNDTLDLDALASRIESTLAAAHGGDMKECATQGTLLAIESRALLARARRCTEYEQGDRILIHKETLRAAQGQAAAAEAELTAARETVARLETKYALACGAGDALLAERHAICDALAIDNDADAENPAGAAMRIVAERDAAIRDLDKSERAHFATHRALAAALARVAAMEPVVAAAIAERAAWDERERMERQGYHNSSRDNAVAEAANALDAAVDAFRSTSKPQGDE